MASKHVVQIARLRNRAKIHQVEGRAQRNLMRQAQSKADKHFAWIRANPNGLPFWKREDYNRQLALEAEAAICTAVGGRVGRRHDNLAYGLLRGLTYFQLEAKCHRKPSVPGIAKRAARFAPKEIVPVIKVWLQHGTITLTEAKNLVAQDKAA